MTTSTPESRARIAYTAYGKTLNFIDHGAMPLYDQLSLAKRDAWEAAAQVIWDLATTGQAKL